MIGGNVGIFRGIFTCAAGALGMLVCGSSAQAAFCFEPRSPSLFVISKPAKPYCATSGSGCESWEIESYRSDVRRYIAQLEEYLNGVEKYRKDAYEYAQCMAKLD